MIRHWMLTGAELQQWQAKQRRGWARCPKCGAFYINENETGAMFQEKFRPAEDTMCWDEFMETYGGGNGESTTS